uniref:Uncharacterized protein n=1 Tax=Chromera velia CCMP2878 TaxID=1169474 RepID=A0A0K6S6M0_9ALVE|eukprot:Cvel_3226.t2-p1 / transcript=Cvel_3226.t2 / gene=Cvel_3226 / organism=Chromera_velia_CCMP2878 / gene_product=Stress response protein NST1, putative / transcript_product=Stress response protein NST1, putative / location=Cvel_scaffold126:61014-64749(+) / protein_length=336 / sequence_SO=supercontig / SO=protein_coding / is_pseudo=false
MISILIDTHMYVLIVQVTQSKEQQMKINQQRAAEVRTIRENLTKKALFEQMEEKRKHSEQRRTEARELLRHKHMMEAQQRLRNSSRAVALQREHNMARQSVNTRKAVRLQKIHEEQEQKRFVLERELMSMEKALPELERREMQCLERLQNSRLVTQAVLQELESSLGQTSPVSTLLRTRTTPGGTRHRSSTTNVRAGGGENETMMMRPATQQAEEANGRVFQKPAERARAIPTGTTSATPPPFPGVSSAAMPPHWSPDSPYAQMDRKEKQTADGEMENGVGLSHDHVTADLAARFSQAVTFPPAQPVGVSPPSAPAAVIPAGGDAMEAGCVDSSDP